MPLSMPRPRPAARPLALVLLVTMASAGCGGGKAHKPTHPVEGKVYWQDAATPAAGALVVFRPVGGSAEDWPEGYPRAIVGPDGRFELTTYEEADGAPAGEYAVLITWPQRTVAPPGDDEGEGAEGEEGEELPDRLGGRYSNPESPPWKKQVTDAGNDPTAFTFVLR